MAEWLFRRVECRGARVRISVEAIYHVQCVSLSFVDSARLFVVSVV